MLVVGLYERQPASVQAGVAGEGARLLAFFAPGVDYDLRFVEPE